MAGEKNFENRIKDYLKTLNAWNVKFFANRMTKTGVPDLLCCVNGRFVGIEVKGPGGEPESLQLWNVKKIRESGGVAMVLYPDQFEEFKAFIEEFLRSGDRDGQKAFDDRVSKWCIKYGISLDY